MPNAGAESVGVDIGIADDCAVIVAECDACIDGVEVDKMPISFTLKF